MQIAQSSGAMYTEDMDMMQRKLLAYGELEKAREIRIAVALRRLRRPLYSTLVSFLKLTDGALQIHWSFSYCLCGDI
jgi:hypothetical protein